MLEIVDRLSSLNQRTVVQQSYRSMYAKQEEDLNNQIVDSDVKIADLSKSIINQQKGMSTYKEILDVMSKEQIIKIQSLVTLALQNIFTDRDYSLDIVFGERGVDRTVELVLVEKKEVSTSEGTNRIELRTSFEDGIGGGVMVVVGFLLQVYFIIYFDLEEVIFCDESFSQLSDVYLPNLLEFIKVLCKEKDFRIVLISHDPRITEEADFIYRVDSGVVTKVEKSDRNE